MAKSRKELEAILSPKQLRAAVLLVESHLSEELDMQGQTQEDICEELKISRMTLWRWNRNPDFVAYKSLLTRNVLGGYEAEMMGLFIKQIRNNPTTRNFELFAKITGILKNQTDVNINDTTKRSEDDIRREMAELDALLKDEDTDFDDVSDVLSDEE